MKKVDELTDKENKKMNKSNRSVYKRPQARDLSGLSASGAGCSSGSALTGPYGRCRDGSFLTSGFCTDGPEPVGGTCSPTGNIPEEGYCNLGQIAHEGCISGSIHT